MSRIVIVTKICNIMQFGRLPKFCRNIFSPSAGNLGICNCAVWYHVRWVPYHHGMVRHQAVDRGDGLQLWSMDANILNKQLQTADKGWSPSLRIGSGANNP
jgi:hypothetical protein